MSISDNRKSWEPTLMLSPSLPPTSHDWALCVPWPLAHSCLPTTHRCAVDRSEDYDISQKADVSSRVKLTWRKVAWEYRSSLNNDGTLSLTCDISMSRGRHFTRFTRHPEPNLRNVRLKGQMAGYGRGLLWISALILSPWKDLRDGRIFARTTLLRHAFPFNYGSS